MKRAMLQEDAEQTVKKWASAVMLFESIRDISIATTRCFTAMVTGACEAIVVSLQDIIQQYLHGSVDQSCGFCDDMSRSYGSICLLSQSKCGPGCRCVPEFRYVTDAMAKVTSFDYFQDCAKLSDDLGNLVAAAIVMKSAVLRSCQYDAFIPKELIKKWTEEAKLGKSPQL